MQRPASLVAIGQDVPAQVPAPPPPPPPVIPPSSGSAFDALTLPNAITVLGYASSLYWLAGGHPAFAIAGLVADEVDGRVARAMGQTSELGSNLDWAVDVTLTGLTAVRAGLPMLAIAPITVAQAALRTREWRPPIGSARALLTVAALVRDHMNAQKSPAKERAPRPGDEPPPPGAPKVTTKRTSANELVVTVQPNGKRRRRAA